MSSSVDKESNTTSTTSSSSTSSISSSTAATTTTTTETTSTSTSTPPNSSTSISTSTPLRAQPKRKISVFSSNGFPNLNLLDESALLARNSTKFQPNLIISSNDQVQTKQDNSEKPHETGSKLIEDTTKPSSLVDNKANPLDRSGSSCDDSSVDTPISQLSPIEALSKETNTTPKLNRDLFSNSTSLDSSISNETTKLNDSLSSDLSSPTSAGTNIGDASSKNPSNDEATPTSSTSTPKFESIKDQIKDTKTMPDHEAMRRHIDKLISQNEAIVDNWKYIPIRSYNHSNPKDNDSINITQSTTSKAASTTTTPVLKLSTAANSNASSNITTTAPSKRSSTSCLLGSSTTFSSTINSSGSTDMLNKLTFPAYMRLSTSNEHPSISSSSGSPFHQQNNQHFPVSTPTCSFGSDYPSDSTGYQSLTSSQSQQNSLCDTTLNLISPQKNSNNLALNRQNPSFGLVSRNRKRSYEVRSRQYHHNRTCPLTFSNPNTSTNIAHASSSIAASSTGSISINDSFSSSPLKQHQSFLDPLLTIPSVLSSTASIQHDLLMNHARQQLDIMSNDMNEIERRWSAACLPPNHRSNIQFGNQLNSIAASAYKVDRNSSASTTFPSRLLPTPTTSHSGSEQQLINENDTNSMIQNLSMKPQARNDKSTSLINESDANSHIPTDLHLYLGQLMDMENQIKAYNLDRFLNTHSKQNLSMETSCMASASTNLASSTTSSQTCLNPQGISIDQMISMAISALQLEHQHQQQAAYGFGSNAAGPSASESLQAPLQGRFAQIEEQKKLLDDLEKFRLTRNQLIDQQPSTSQSSDMTNNLFSQYNQTAAAAAAAASVDDSTNQHSQELKLAALKNLLSALNIRQEQVQQQAQLSHSPTANNQQVSLEQQKQLDHAIQFLPTTEHSPELLTQSLDSTARAYKCQLCSMAFYTKNLLNYHQLTQCTGIINVLGLISNLHGEVTRLIQQHNDADSPMSTNSHQQQTLTKPSSSQAQSSTSYSNRAVSQPLGPDLSLINESFQNQFNKIGSIRLEHQQRPAIRIQEVSDTELMYSSETGRSDGASSTTPGQLDQRHLLTDITPATTTSNSSNQSLSSDLSCGGPDDRPSSATMISSIATTTSTIANNNNSLLPNGYLPLKKRKISAPGFIS